MFPEDWGQALEVHVPRLAETTKAKAPTGPSCFQQPMQQSEEVGTLPRAGAELGCQGGVKSGIPSLPPPGAQTAAASPALDAPVVLEKREHGAIWLPFCAASLRGM